MLLEQIRMDFLHLGIEDRILILGHFEFPLGVALHAEIINEQDEHDATQWQLTPGTEVRRALSRVRFSWPSTSTITLR